jgi:hypothetical protein
MSFSFSFIMARTTLAISFKNNKYDSQISVSYFNWLDAIIIILSSPLARYRISTFYAGNLFLRFITACYEPQIHRPQKIKHFPMYMSEYFNYRYGIITLPCIVIGICWDLRFFDICFTIRLLSFQLKLANWKYKNR